jgi:hypothetical protein
MTITWEWECGAHYADDSRDYEFGAGNFDVNYWTVVTATPKTGSANYSLNSYSGSGAKKATTASRQKRVGMFIKTAKPAADYYPVVALRDASDNLLIQMRIKSDGAASLYVAGSEQDTYADYPQGAYRHLGLDAKVDSSAGWAVVYLDGVEIMRFEGNTGNADITQVYFGVGPAWPAVNLLYDDIYCEDTAGEAAAAAVPLRQFYEMTLSGDGNYSNFDGSDGNKTNNYALVDENPPNEDTDYVAAVAADVIDSYATTNYTLPVGMTVNAVHPFVIAKKMGSAATTVKTFLREDSVDWAGAAQSLASDYALKIERRTTDPGGAAWDQTSINGLEVGAKSAGAYS